MNKILLVDDDKVTLAVTSRILADEGYEMDHAYGLQMARERLVHGQYDVVITDMNMPDAQGSTIIENMKTIRPQAEIIVMTAHGTLDMVIECMRAGAVDFLLKPCSGEQLIKTVRKTIEKKELSQENIMLRVVNEMKDKFLTLVSHELRTPLTLIYGYLSILQKQGASLADDQIDLVTIVLKSTKQLINIVNNIQLITQAESGEIKLHVQPIATKKLLTDVMAEIKASCTQRKLNMRMELSEELDEFNGDSIRLRQAVMEVLQNAVKNTPDGGEVILGARQEHDQLFIWIQDNGIGISKAEQSKIFEPFYEVADVKQHSTSSHDFGGGGIGIGLSLVKAVITAHDGSIRLDSEEGKGTKVEFVLPFGQQLTKMNSGLFD
jgi:signal transduction histidine kinase